MVKRFTIQYVDLYFKTEPICSCRLVIFYKIPRELPESHYFHSPLLAKFFGRAINISVTAIEISSDNLVSYLNLKSHISRNKIKGGRNEAAKSDYDIF